MDPVTGKVTKTRRDKGNAADAIAHLFGPPAYSSEFAGAVRVTDARLLAYPARSLKRVFAWVTCPAVMERFERDAKLAGFTGVPPLDKLKPTSDLCGFVPPDCPCVIGGKHLLLEEFKFDVTTEAAVTTWADTVAKALLPDEPHYKATRGRFARQLAVLGDDDFTHCVRFATEVTARIGLDYETRTVKDGALFNQEFLPTESLFYSVAIVNQARTRIAPKAAGVLMRSLEEMMTAVPGGVLQIGGDETTGKGYCSVRLRTTAEDSRADGPPTPPPGRGSASTAAIARFPRVAPRHPTGKGPSRLAPPPSRREGDERPSGRPASRAPGPAASLPRRERCNAGAVRSQVRHRVRSPRHAAALPHRLAPAARPADQTRRPVAGRGGDPKTAGEEWVERLQCPEEREAERDARPRRAAEPASGRRRQGNGLPRGDLEPVQSDLPLVHAGPAVAARPRRTQEEIICPTHTSVRSLRARRRVSDLRRNSPNGFEVSRVVWSSTPRRIATAIVRSRGWRSRTDLRTQRVIKVVLNFAHPLTDAHLAQVAALAGRPIDRVVAVPTHLDCDRPFSVQVRELLATVWFTPDEWQTLPLAVNPPSLASSRVSSSPNCTTGGSNPMRYEVIDLVKLQSVRDTARSGR